MSHAPGSSPAKVVQYEALFSKEARELKASALADLVNSFNGIPDVVTLHAGLPSAETFPMLSLTATTVNASAPCSSSSSNTDTTAATAACGTPQGSTTVHVSGKLLQDAQQYMFHSGHPPLLRWARDIAANVHKPCRPVECAITSGAVNALAAAIACLCDTGDYVICEQFAYTHAPECVFLPRGLNLLPVAMDDEGMVPADLQRVLDETPPSPVTGKLPRVVYLIPSGQNPTGAVMSLSRKQQIYDICRKHDLIVLEDDAYFWLQYPDLDSVPECEQPGLQLPPSFLTLDQDSRVLRIDTFAKLLGPGYRLGWVTGHPTLVAKVAQAVQAGSCGPCSLSQVVVSQLLHAWGPAGFEAFVRRQQALYARKAATAIRAAEQHLQGLATWLPPKAGMFMWCKLTVLEDFGPELVQQLVSHRVAVIPGRPFWTEIAKARGGALCAYFRVTFGAAPDDQIAQGFERLACAICTAAGPCLTLGPVLPTLPSSPAATATIAATAHIAVSTSAAITAGLQQAGVSNSNPVIMPTVSHRHSLSATAVTVGGRGSGNLLGCDAVDQLLQAAHFSPPPSSCCFPPITPTLITTPHLDEAISDAATAPDVCVASLTSVSSCEDSSSGSDSLALMDKTPVISSSLPAVTGVTARRASSLAQCLSATSLQGLTTGLTSKPSI